MKNVDQDRSEEFMKRWENFKVTLPHMHPPYSKRNWGNGLHSVCSYQGKMKPALASFLVKVFSDENDLVLIFKNSKKFNQKYKFDNYLKVIDFFKRWKKESKNYKFSG